MSYQEAMALILGLAKAEANTLGRDAARYAAMGYPDAIPSAAKCRADEARIREAIAVVEAEMMAKTS